jgi:hypothetical protein
MLIPYEEGRILLTFYSMYVFQERSRQERARSPLKGIIISIASHIIRPFLLFPVLDVTFTRPMLTCFLTL